MREFRNSAFLFLLLAGLLVSPFQNSASFGQLPVLDFVVLRGATVIDGLGNPPLANATVVVEGDRIRLIFSGQDPTYPTDATVIDLSGKFVIPGFVDTHVHWEGWMGEIFVNHGITSVLAQADISKQERFGLEILCLGVAQPGFQPQPCLFRRIRNLVDNEPGQIGSTQSFMLIQRAK